MEKEKEKEKDLSPYIYRTRRALGRGMTKRKAGEMEKKRKVEMSDQGQDSLGRGIAKRKAAEKHKEMAEQRVEKEVAADQPEVFQFGKRVRHLISKIRSIPDGANLKEAFLWALLQNRQESVVDYNNHGAELAELPIHIVPDKKNGSLSIIDTGNGMNHNELQSYLCDIPKHAHQKYLRTIKKYNTTSSGVDLSCLISHDPEFSLGFHSAYMVADKVMVTTKKTGGDQYLWGWELESNGCHSCTITRDASSETKLDSGGTMVTLFLNHNHLKYAEEHILNGLLKKYVKLLTYPVYILADDDDAQKKTMKEIVDDEKQKEELVPMDIWWDDELRHCVSKYIREREFKLPVPVDDSDDERLPIDPSYEQGENWFESMKYRYGRRERRRENAQYILEYWDGIRPVHVRCILPGTAIDLDDVMFFEIPWVAVRGIDTTCVVTRHQDLSRLIAAQKYPAEYERQSFRISFWNISIVFVEGILQAYFPDSFWESQQMSANKSSKSPFDFGVASCDESSDEPCQSLHKSSKEPSGVFALIGGRNKDNEITDDGEKLAIKFLQQQMARNIAFTSLKTIQTAKTAFKHLFCQKFKDDDLRVFVLKNDGSLGRELNPEHECMYWKVGAYGYCD